MKETTITLFVYMLVEVATANFIVSLVAGAASFLTVLVQFSRLKKIIREEYEGSWIKWMCQILKP